MAPPTTAREFLTIARQSGVINETAFRGHFRRDDDLPGDAAACATALIRAHLLTPFQAKHLLAGKFRGLCLGPYKILNQIGQGGMGAVYLAEHTELDRQVALKMLPAAKAKDKVAVERFKREARAAAALDHPNIVKVFDVFQAGGLYFMVMEYVAGKDLGSLVKENGPLHFATAIAYTLQAAAGLQHAHDKGFVHRDIKPDNLILSKEGAVKLLDMGLTRSFEERDQITAALDHGSVVGTADFISPEQALGESQDQRSDLYSLGATLYALIAGSPPFKGHTTQLLMQHQLADPPRLSKKLKSAAPEGLDEVIAKMMAKKPADRFQSADDLIETLSPFVSGEPGGAAGTATGIRRNSTGKVARARPGPQGYWARHKWAGVGGLVVAAVAVVGAFLAFGPSGSSPQKSPPPAPAPAPVAAAKAAADLCVKMAKYEATVGPDGMMPSFRVNDAEFLNAKVSVSRGLYLWQNWNLPKLEDVQQADNVVTAKGEAGTIRYTFGPNRLDVAITNATRADMVVFLVFDATEAAMNDGLGQWNKLPFEVEKADAQNARWAKTEWFSGKAKVTLTAPVSFRGPWEGQQLAELIVAPGATKSLAFEAGTPTEAEAARAAAVIGKTIGQGLRVDWPRDYQVYQRRSRSAGAVAVRGRVEIAAGRVDARVRGTGPDGALPDRWVAAVFEPVSRAFTADLPAPAGGWYEVDVRAFDGDKVVTEGTVKHVGVGEVFVTAGQSNATNCGEEKLKTASGMVATYSGQTWRLANDPQPGVHDNSGGGSPWPAFGDALYARYRVPIGIASTGHAGSSITQWRTDGELFRWTAQRVKQLDRHGFRAVLWHQGESDVAMDGDAYARQLTDLIRASREAAGWNVPWFVAQTTYHNPTNRSSPAIRAAQRKVCDDGTALAGPDTDDLTGDNRDNGGKGIHFSGKGLQAHGHAWAEKVSVVIDREVAN